MEEGLKEKLGQILKKENIFVEKTFQYSPIEGDVSLREEIAKWLKRKWQQEIEVASIFITNNAIQSLFLLSHILLKKEDKVLVEDPTYLGALDIFTQKRYPAQKSTDL